MLILSRRCAAPVTPLLSRPSAAGFTLIELLTVIAIIGILAAIVIPTVGSVRDKAQRAVDGNNLREILKAAQVYASDNQDRLPDPQNINNATLNSAQAIWKWPGILAKNKILENPEFYFAKNDAAFNPPYPTFIILPSIARNQLHPTFINRRSPSWEFVGGVKMNDNPNTPVVYTRGLQSNGTWSTTSGVYKDTGGFIAYLGGNVAFYSNTNNPTIFTSNNPNSTNANKFADIRVAIPFNTANTNQSARIYGIPPVGIGAGGMIGTANGTLASRGP